VSAADDLVAQAITALREIKTPDDVARSAHESADEIERTWPRSPYIAALDGELPARTELVNTLCGEKLLDPFARAIGSAALRVRRGKRLKCRVLYSDRTRADRAIPEPEPISDFGTTEREDEVRGELAVHETALAAAEADLPAVLRRRPAMWAVWLWLVRAILWLAHRATLARWRASNRALAETRRRLAAIEEFSAQREAREQAGREKYFAELRALASGGPAGEGIREVELEIPSELLPAGVELVEVTGATRPGIDSDATLVVSREGISLDNVVLGQAADVFPRIVELLVRGRAKKLAQRVRDRLQALRAEIDVEIARAERELARRIEKVEALAVTQDRTRFVAVQLERIRPQIVASTQAVMEHASVHLGSELAQLGTQWIDPIAKCTNIDELKAAIAAIEERWVPAPQRIASEVKTLVMGGAGGVARDLYADAVSPLRAHGLPEAHLKAPKLAPVVPAVPILPALLNPSQKKLGGSWIGGLLKGFDSRKQEVREKVHARVQHLKEVAAAEMLDAEPRLHAAIGQALAAEYTTVSHERLKLAPLVESRDHIISRGVQLGQLADAVAQPADIAAAS
jgi:predicted amino acid-binding ACT domain protein